MPFVLGLGEVLWDLLPAGPQLGGAPANFALHARALGAEAALVTRVGRDARGQAARARLEAAGLPLNLVQEDPAAPTGTVAVTLAADGQPAFIIHEDAAWDRLEAAPEALAAAGRADAVCFGTLAQRDPRARAAILALLASARPEALRVFDVNLRQHFHTPAVIEASLRRANVLKVNDAEWPVLAAQFGLAGGLPAQLAELARRFELKALAVTRGADGALLWRDGELAEAPALPVTVADTIGAGDAFTAAMTLGLLAGRRAFDVVRLANEVAAFVCTRPGATPALPSRFREALAARHGGAA